MFSKFKVFDGVNKFTWVDPDTGRAFQESSKKLLIDRIQSYRKANNLEEIEHISFVLENYWCSLPENAGRCEPIQQLPRGVVGYLKGGIALMSTVLYKSFAHQNTADARAKQCVKCPYNVFPDKTGFRAWSDWIAVKSVERRESIHREELGECAICTCPLKAKVFWDGPVDIKPEWEEPLKEVKCWQLDIRKN